MKLRINLSAVTSLGVTLLFVLGSAGCASSGHHAMISHDAPGLTGEVRHNSRENLARGQGLGFLGGSAVSPLGDAPGERDLESTREWPAERQPLPVGIAKTGLGR